METQVLDISQFATDDVAALRLMEHVASGRPSTWAVYDASGTRGTYTDYEEASKVFDSIDASRHPSLCLWTKVGTSVTFRYKAPKKVMEAE